MIDDFNSVPQSKRTGTYASIFLLNLTLNISCLTARVVEISSWNSTYVGREEKESLCQEKAGKRIFLLME